MRPSLHLAATTALLLCSCSRTYVVEAEASIHPPAGQVRSYTIRRLQSQDPKDSLRYQEAENLLKAGLAGRGLYEAPKPELADIQVEFDYGMADPKVQLHLVRNPIYNPGLGRMEKRVVGTDKDGKPITATVPVSGEAEIVGYRERLDRGIAVEKHVRLVARDNHAPADGRLPPEIWNVYVRNTDDNQNLRRYLPVMIAVGVDYIGKDSNGVNTFQVTLEDGVPVYISGGFDQARTVTAVGTDPGVVPATSNPLARDVPKPAAVSPFSGAEAGSAPKTGTAPPASPSLP